MKLRCQCGQVMGFANPKEGMIARCPHCVRRYRLTREGDRLLPVPIAAESANAGAASSDAGVEAMEPARIATWWSYLAQAWFYPFRREIGIVLLGWIGVDFIARIVMPFALLLIPFGSLILFLVQFCVFGVFFLYMFEIVRQGAWDPDAQPSLPQFEDFHESAVRPVGLVLVVAFGSALPYLLAMAAKWVATTPPWWGHVVTAGVVISLFMVPMNTLAVATADSGTAINPRYTFPAVARILLPYTVFCLFSGSLLLSCFMLLKALYMAAPISVAVPVGDMLLVYCCAVSARALGTLHHVYAERIGWLREMEE